MGAISLTATGMSDTYRTASAAIMSAALMICIVTYGAPILANGISNKNQSAGCPSSRSMLPNRAASEASREMSHACDSSRHGSCSGTIANVSAEYATNITIRATGMMRVTWFG